MLWFFVGTLGGEHPIGCFRQMPGDRTDCDTMPLCCLQPFIELNNMAEMQGFMPHGKYIRCFYECPLQIMIDIGRGVPVPHVPS